MARLGSRQDLITYGLRALGEPVITVNIELDQINDRLDDALQFFAERHFDGVEKVFLRHTITDTDKANRYIDMSGVTSPDPNDLIMSITRVFAFEDDIRGIFDVRYQYALNDLYTMGSIDLIHYDLVQQYMSLVQILLSPDKAIRFSRVNNKLSIDTDWTMIPSGTQIVIEAYRILDPATYTEIYNDRYLKRYFIALLKRQWGANLRKYQGITLPGGVTLNGDQLYTEAEQELKDIEAQMINETELPIDFFTG